MRYILLFVGLSFATISPLSHRDLTGRLLLDANIPEGDTIIGSCFSQESPVKIFPSSMTGVVFIGDNLDNVIMPPGNDISTSSNLQFVYNPADSSFWLVDKNGKMVSKK